MSKKLTSRAFKGLKPSMRFFSCFNQHIEDLKLSVHNLRNQGAEFKKPILLGLGNSLIENYEGTRHNVGNMYLDYLARTKKLSLQKVDFGEVGECEDYIVLKSSIKMNESGSAVLALQDLLELSREEMQQNVVVLTDDLDNKLGKAKLKIGGSALGHNGIKSVSNAFEGSLDFKRVLFGISRPQVKGVNSIIDHVMGEFDSSEVSILEASTYPAVDKIISQKVLEKRRIFQR